MVFVKSSDLIENMCPPYSHSNYDGMVKDLWSGYADALNESLDGAACNLKTSAVTPHQDDKDNHNDDAHDDDDDDVVVEEDVV